MRGALFESFVLGEIKKARFNRGEQDGVFFWRDRAGHEIDAVIERKAGLQPIEAKSGQTLNPDFFSGLRRWLELAGPAAVDPVLVYGGDQPLTHQGIRAVPWRDCDWQEPA
jgi:predicted AAA+ superfamily ATPase